MRLRKPGILALVGTLTVSGAVLTLSSSGHAAPLYTFSAPKTVDNTTGSSEPGIMVDGTGKIFINAPSGLPGPSHIWRSVDGGSTFTSVGPANVGSGGNVTVGGGDSNLAADALGNLYFVDLWLADASTAVSHDSGTTWTGIPLGTVPIQDRPWVSADPRPGQPGTAYSVTEQLGTGIFLSKTVSGPVAGTFYPVSVLEASDVSRGLVGAAPAGPVVTNQKGDTYNVYSVFNGSNGAGLSLGVLPAGSLTPTTRPVTPAMSAHDQTQSFPVVAVDNAADDNLYVVWTDPVSASTWNIEFASSTNGGVTWSNAVTLGQGVYPWVTADAAGKVDVAWYSAQLHNYGGDPNAAKAGTTWDVVFAQSVNALAATPRFTTPEAAATAVKSGAICTQGTNCSGDRQLGDFMSIAHDAAGHALIAYVWVPSTGPSAVEFTAQSAGTTIN